MREFFRKPYLSKNYDEMMTRRTNSEAWQNTVEQHSEFEKPYQEPNYSKMQHYRSTGPGYGPDLLKFDMPEDPYGPVEGGHYVFFCGIQPCWCAGQTLTFPTKCTYEIIRVVARDRPGSLGYAATSQSISITANPGTTSGKFYLDIEMKTPSLLHPDKFVYGWHMNIEVARCLSDSKCNECSACETESPVISPTTQSLSVNEELDLSVADYGSIPSGCFSWAISDPDHGTLTDIVAYGVTYTAPATNAECANNPTITLLCDEVVVDTLTIAVNAVSGGTSAYGLLGSCTGKGLRGDCLCTGPPGPDVFGRTFNCSTWDNMKCDGTYYNQGKSISHLCGPDPPLDPWGPESYIAHCSGVGINNCTTTTSTCTVGVSGCACMLTYWATVGFSGWGDSIDNRTEAQITAGCCPGDLL